MFNKEGSKWVAEFKATSDFNLHIERDLKGFLFLKQRTAEGGEYDSTSNASFAPMDSVVDYDFTGLIYPKFIKIVSEVEPTYAAVTTSGEVTEIKSQSKEIEVTSNGTTEVAPDTGFAYLNSVKVKTNVAGGGEGSGDTMEYFRAQDAPQLKPYMSAVKMVAHGGVVTQVSNYMPKLANIVESAEILAFGVDFQARNVVAASGQKLDMISLYGIIQETGLSADQIAAIPRITKEEFYNLA